MVPSCLAEAGVLEVVIEFYDKTDMFIHHLGAFLSPNSRSRVDIDKGKFIKIAISHEVVQLLEGEEFSGCAGNFDPDGDYDECIYSNLYRLMMDKVGCTVPWLPIKSDICSDFEKRNEIIIFEHRIKNFRT